jgi:Na+-transporting NADH:ubiquinone oxidoreductase subunit NqrF
MSKVRISYRATVTVDIDLAKVRSYLESKGWKYASVYGPYGEIFEKGSDGILVPKVDTVADINNRMSELLEDLATDEGRQVPDVLKDIQAL